MFTPSLSWRHARRRHRRGLRSALRRGHRAEAYAIVAMGAVVAATTGAPITAILLVFEMTGDYALVPALMVTVVISAVVARRVERDDLYSGWLRRRGEHLRHGEDRDVLSGLTVADAYERDAVTVRESEPVHSLLQHLGSRDQSVFPVVDVHGRLVGVLTMIELGAVARADRALDDVVIASDVAQPSEVVAPGTRCWRPCAHGCARHRLAPRHRPAHRARTRRGAPGRHPRALRTFAGDGGGVARRLWLLSVPFGLCQMRRRRWRRARTPDRLQP